MRVKRDEVGSKGRDGRVMEALRVWEVMVPRVLVWINRLLVNIHCP